MVMKFIVVIGEKTYIAQTNLQVFIDHRIYCHVSRAWEVQDSSEEIEVDSEDIIQDIEKVLHQQIKDGEELPLEPFE